MKNKDHHTQTTKGAKKQFLRTINLPKDDMKSVQVFKAASKPDTRKKILITIVNQSSKNPDQ